jgi:hypothetical protein
MSKKKKGKKVIVRNRVQLLLLYRKCLGAALCEQVDASLVKRYGNVNQGCGCSSGKGNVNFM